MTATRTAPVTEANTPQRKRGAALEDAIREAAYAELTEVGYTAFSVEGVAARARTGKASIYRRWPTKQDLVTDALCTGLPTPAQCGMPFEPDDSVTTADALRTVARTIARVITSPAGDAVRAIKCEAAADPELAQLIDDRFQAPRRAALLGLLQRGVERGEVRPDAVTALVADVIPAVLTHRVILQREPLGEADITAIIEQVFIPLIEAR
ncbi:MAG TPA: TetR/AcrR family transcriptional regulator [Jatrophihabitans sp.]|jgi:AcrR family transcriptional regulator|uniref:TetR/AcrR family transcriptional regulator n=1 Tax=Jatrophihabitans sp. TaxID=1932789 RepID=UPI002E07FDC5|nr:TetR/AcrR family transcriptional regulator [Jatrophihabitans sp.]